MQRPATMNLCLTIFVAASLSCMKVAGVKPGTPSLTVYPDPATVDVGLTVLFTCVKNAADAVSPTVWEFYIDGTKATAGVTVHMYAPSTLTAARVKQITCKAGDGSVLSDASAPKPLTITAIPAPTLTSSIAEIGGKVTVVNGSTVTFTCAKGATVKQDPVSFKFYESVTAITLLTPGASIVGGVLAVTASPYWQGKLITCTYFNTFYSKTDANKAFILEVVVPDRPTIDFTTPLTEGTELKVTCTQTGAVVGTEFEFYKDNTKLATGITSSTGTLNDIYTVAAVTTANENGKKYKCSAKNAQVPSEYSEEKTLVVEAIPAPTLISSIAEIGGKVTVKNGLTVTFTCTKGATAHQDPVGFKFYEGATEITSATPGASITGGVLTVTASSAWEAKVIKCTHYNTATLKTDSTKTFTLEVMTWVSASDSSTGVAVSALVFALIAIIVIVVIVIIHCRNAGDKAAADSSGIEVSNKSVARHNIAYEADQEPSQATPGNNDIWEIGEFRKWLLSQHVTEETYATLEKDGLHDPVIFANMKPDQVLRLSIKPLGQEFLIQKIAEGFNQGKSPFLACRGNMSDSIL